MPDEVQPVVTAPAELAMPAHGDPAIPAITPAPVVPKEVFFAGRKFSSETDALAFASSMAPVAPAAAVVPVDTAKEISELMFTDPVAYHRATQEDTMRKMEQKYVAQKQLEETWNNFYEKNQDLRGFKDLVAGSQSVLWEDVKTIPLDQAMDRIAKHARGILQRAGVPAATNRERLGNVGAGGISPSLASGPAPLPQAEKRLTFVEEMKQMREKRKKIS